MGLKRLSVTQGCRTEGRHEGRRGEKGCAEMRGDRERGVTQTNYVYSHCVDYYYPDLRSHVGFLYDSGLKNC